MEKNPKEIVDVKTGSEKRSGLKPRCSWCGDAGAELKTVGGTFRNRKIPLPVCSERCRLRTEDFLSKDSAGVFRFAILMMAIMLVGIILIIITMNQDGGAWGVLVMFVGNGILINLHPFVTRHAIEAYGIKKTIATAKLLGKVQIVLGILFFMIMLFILR